MRSRRRLVLGGLAALAAASAPRFTLAQQMRRIAVAMVVSPADANARLDLIRQRLRELGYAEGKNLHIDLRTVEGRFDRMPAVIAELLALRPDVLVTGGTVATREAKRATATVPVVMCAIADPVESGLVASWARPGGNITGVSTHVDGQQIAGKRLELLREIAPSLSSVAAPYDPRNTPEVIHFRELQSIAQVQRIEVRPVELAAGQDSSALLGRELKAKPHGMLVHEGGLALIGRAQIVEFAAHHRIPAVYGVRQFVDAGGLLSYGPSYADHFRRAADYIDLVLKGAKPATLAIEQPRVFELVINLKTAKAMGLEIPRALLLRADHVIQ